MIEDDRTPDLALIGHLLASYAGPADEAPPTFRASEERAIPEPTEGQNP